MAKPILVQKYGGTSVGKFPKDIASDIVKQYQKNNSVVVVCSARSTNIKAEGTTSCLLKAAETALSRSGNFRKEIGKIHEAHVTAAEQVLGKDSVLLQELVQQIDAECAHCIEILQASKILNEVSNRTMDLVLSVGEKLACLYMTAVIKSVGVKAEYVDLSTLVPLQQGGEVDHTLYEQIKVSMKERLAAIDQDTVPVVTGFFGLLPGGLISAVGRGYTDLCAALIAVALKADELQIWKEVDGIFTADPRKVPTARLLSQISPEEASELTYYGSEVIHPFTMEQVIKARIPIRIKNVMDPTADGTIVFPETESRNGTSTPVHPPLSVSRSFVSLAEARKGPTAVTSKNNIIVLNIHSNRTKGSHGFLALVFGILDRWKLVVDLISTSEVHISMAIHAQGPESALPEAVKELRNYASVDVTSNLCIVSLVGKNMKQYIGIAGQMFTTLAESGVNLEMISQGASEINISCVINEKDALKAVNVLHHKLLHL